MKDTLKKDQIPQFLYIVHRTDWPSPLGKHPHLNLNPPKLLLKTGTEGHLYPLSEEEVEKKGKVITMYKTQMKVMKDFLLAFDRKTKLYGFYRSRINVRFKNGIVYISIPLDKDFAAIYLSTFTTSGKSLIDKTAWRLLEKEK
ncbi:hypothetical protein QTP99_05685 [Caldanaerobacter subterraneus KAk]|uniref:hypothetical protein n=1 Tax=Caldanaerobacter subterraneus TaxID=911092 RepID=UPI0032BF5ED6